MKTHQKLVNQLNKGLFCVILLFFSHCLSAQITVSQTPTYGGAITGTITFPKDLLAHTGKNLNELTAYLKANITTYQYREVYYSPTEMVHIRKLSNKALDKVNIIATVELKNTTDKHYIFEYSVGFTSKGPILSTTDGPVTVLNVQVPYSVAIPVIQSTIGNSGITFRSDFTLINGLTPDLGVANLTENDRTFECYNFTVIKVDYPN